MNHEHPALRRCSQSPARSPVNDPTCIVRPRRRLRATLDVVPRAAAWNRNRPEDGQSAADTLDPSYIYGIADNNDIYQINPDQKTFGVVYNTGLFGQSNTFAFDRDRDQMFFVHPSGTFAGTPYTNGLFLWNKPAGTFSLLAANGSSFGITGGTVPANAAYHNDAFWFFNEGSLSLTRADLTLSGTGAGAVPTGVASVQAFTMATGTSLTAGQNRFGDVAINTITNTLFAYTTQAQGGKL